MEIPLINSYNVENQLYNFCLCVIMQSISDKDTHFLNRSLFKMFYHLF